MIFIFVIIYFSLLIIITITIIIIIINLIHYLWTLDVVQPAVESHEKNLICYLTNRGSTKYNDFDWLLIYIRSTNHGSTAVQPTVQPTVQLAVQLAVQPYQLNRGWFGLASTAVEPRLSQPFNIPTRTTYIFSRIYVCGNIENKSNV